MLMKKEIIPKMQKKIMHTLKKEKKSMYQPAYTFMNLPHNINYASFTLKKFYSMMLIIWQSSNSVSHIKFPKKNRLLIKKENLEIKIIDDYKVISDNL